MNLTQIQSDFDRIAALSARATERAGPYERWLERQLPQRLGRVLEIGCGLGLVARRLARRAESVLAIDLSPRMIELARQRSIGIANLRFEVADVMTMDLPRDAFDAIVSVATLHHLPAEPALLRFRDALRPGGTLAIVDLVRSSGWRDRALDAVALFASLPDRAMQSRALRRAWQLHGQHDSYLTIDAARALCARLLPDAALRRHLRWRYSIVWRKP